MFQTEGALTAIMGFDGEPLPVCFKSARDDLDTITFQGTVGNGAFVLCTLPDRDTEIVIVGKAKAKPNTVKLKSTGVI